MLTDHERALLNFEDAGSLRHVTKIGVKSWAMHPKVHRCGLNYRFTH